MLDVLQIEVSSLTISELNKLLEDGVEFNAGGDLNVQIRLQEEQSYGEYRSNKKYK